LMVWVYAQSKSVFVQLMHASSTGCLVVLSPPHTSPAAETLWYAAYAAALSLIGIVVVTVGGKQLTRQNV